MVYGLLVNPHLLLHQSFKMDLLTSWRNFLSYCQRTRYRALVWMVLMKSEWKKYAKDLILFTLGVAIGLYSFSLDVAKERSIGFQAGVRAITQDEKVTTQLCMRALFEIQKEEKK